MQMLELDRLQRARTQHAAFAYRMPAHLVQEVASNDLQQSASLNALPSGRTPRVGSAAPQRWVHHPLNDLWRLQLNAKGLMEWMELEPTGSIPFPRSRHSFEAVPKRGLCLLFGGRSVQAATVLNDTYILDVPECHWACINLCGVPPSPRECSAATVFGASLLVFGGRGRTCQDDVAIFHLSAEARTGNLLSATVSECPGMWEHPYPNQLPSRRQGHEMVAYGSRRLLTIGGFSTDDEAYSASSPTAGALEPMGRGMALAVEKIFPVEAPVEGDIKLTIQGLGFNAQTRYKVRFAVPHGPPAPPPASAATSAAALAAAPLPIALSDSEPFTIVLATYVDSRTIECIVPDMSASLCDGHVLIEVCAADGGEEMWTTDEVELMLTSTVDVSQLRLKGPTKGVVGQRITMTLHTYDHTGRKRSTGGDKFTCGLRNPGGPPEEGAEVPLLTPEAEAKDMDNGTHELQYYFERAGEYLFTILLEGRIVTESQVVLEAGPTDAATCDLDIKPLPKGPIVTLTAGAELQFSVVPRDRFGNSSGHRGDAHVSKFSWKLQKLPPTVPKDDEDALEYAKSLPPPRVAEVQAFQTLAGIGVDVIESGDYELSVVHTTSDGVEHVVQRKPVKVKCEPGPLSPAHCTLTGSGLHTCYPEGMSAQEREIILTARDGYGNPLGRAVPGLREALQVTLRNTDAGLTNPMVEVSELATAFGQDAQLRAAYGVRLLGSFILFVELHHEELLSKPLRIVRASEKPEDAPPDNEAVWKVPYSLQAERERLAAIAREEARQAELARQAAAKALDESLLRDWDSQVSMALSAAGVPRAGVYLLEKEHRKLRDLHAAFSYPEEPRAASGRKPIPPPALAAETPEALAEASLLPRLSLRGWVQLSNWARLVDSETGRTRSHLNTLYVQAATTVGGVPKPKALASGTVVGAGGEAIGLNETAYDESSELGAGLTLPAFALLISSLAHATPIEEAAAKEEEMKRMMAQAAPDVSAEVAAAPAAEEEGAATVGGAEDDGAGGEGATAAPGARPMPRVAPEDEPYVERLDGYVNSKLFECPLIEVISPAAAQEDDDNEEYEVVPPWSHPDGGWEQLLARKADVWKIFQSYAVLPAGAETVPGGESGDPPEGFGTGGAMGNGTEALTLSYDKAMELVQDLVSSLCSFIAESLTVERAGELFARVQGERYDEGQEVPEEIMAIDYEECLTWLWLCCKERFEAESKGYAGKVKDFLATLPQLAKPAAPAPEPLEPKSPEGKGKGKGKGK